MTHMITLSLLILAVIAVRAIFRGSVSPKMIYALWLVVLLKLCMPFSLFDVALPRQNEANINEIPHTAESSALHEVTGPMIQDNTVSEPPQNTVGNISDITPADTGISGIGHGVIPDKAENINGMGGAISSSPSVGDTVLSGTAVKKIPITSILRVIWVCGSVLLALWFAVTSFVFSVGVFRDRSRVGRYKGLKVYISEKVGTPCLRGIIPSVYLTPKAFSSDGRRLILAHEYTHLRHGDNVWSFFRISALILLWWNPLVWAAALLSKQDSELACDYSLGQKMNDDQRINYARIIVDMIPAKKNLANGFANGSVKERIIMMTKKNKNRILSALLAISLVLIAASCSFVGITDGDETQAEDRTDIIDVPEIVPDEFCYKIISNPGGFGINYVYIPNVAQSVHHELVSFSKDRWLYKVDRISEYGTFDLYLVDISKGEILDTLTVYSDVMPSRVMFQNDDYILYRMHYDTDQQKVVIECAFKVTYENGELFCKKADIEMFPYAESYIESEDGNIRVYEVVANENGHGGIDIVYSDGRVERIAENVMLDDIIDGKTAGIGDVKGYAPIAFLDANRFVYRIGGWEWIWGYGIYDISTGEKTEYLDGLGIQAIDAEGNFYATDVKAYEPLNYYKISKLTSEGELLATYEEEAPDGVIKLERHSKKSFDYSDNYGTIHEFTEDGVHTYTVTTPDFQTELIKYELDNSMGTINTYIRDGFITFVVFGNEPTYPYTDKSELTEIFKQFLAGGQEGESGMVLKNRMLDLTGWSDEDTDNQTPQQYFTRWQNKAIELYISENHETLKLEQPEYYLLGSLTEKYFDYYKFSGFIPNENAETVTVSKPLGDTTYFYLCKDKNDPKKTYIYYTRDFGRTIGSVDVELPENLEFDSITPAYLGEINGEYKVIYKLTQKENSYYINFSGKAPYALSYEGKTDDEIINSYVDPRLELHARVDIGGGHALQIELKYSKNKIVKSDRAAYNYEHDDVNELYMWRIVKVFGNNYSKALIASDRYPAWVIADVKNQTVTNAFPNLDKTIIEKIENVETHDGDQFAIQLDNGKIYYHESFNKFTFDIEELGILGADYAEIADNSTLAIFKIENGYADIYTHHVISGEEKLLFKKIPWNENDPKALKLHNSKGYGTYFIQNILHILDFRTGGLNTTDIEYSKGITVEGINEYVVNVKFDSISYLTRGLPVR